MSLLLQKHMEAKGVKCLLADSVMRIVGSQETGVTAIETRNTRIPCELVILAAGVRPNSKLAADAGLAIGMHGGIIVDDRLRTTDPDIYAGGDCIEMLHLVSGQRVPMPLGSLANRQGRIIGTNIAGGSVRFKGTVGTFCLKIFDLAVAKAGLTEKQAVAAGFTPVHFYPTHGIMHLKLIADRKSRQILGIEAVGPNGDASSPASMQWRPCCPMQSMSMRSPIWKLLTPRHMHRPWTSSTTRPTPSTISSWDTTIPSM